MKWKCLEYYFDHKSLGISRIRKIEVGMSQPPILPSSVQRHREKILSKLQNVRILSEKRIDATEDVAELARCGSL